MRTTLNIDDDVLAAARERAEAEGTAAGKVLSDLARETWHRTSMKAPKYRNGLPLLPHRKGIVTVELVDKLLNEE
jgi:hypothetical protein